MIKLPKDLTEFNMTNKEYMALSVEERNFLNENLKANNISVMVDNSDKT